MITLIDPSTIRANEPIFHLERIYNSKIHDIEGRALPAIISFWVSDKEIREMKVLVKKIEFLHLDYDVRKSITLYYPSRRIIGEIELI